ncbi:MAG: hypothetical protein HXX13_14980 [Bacteroidetes bacterium]|nr:hypothetical protein [Bacteroidota bacterium]
MQKNLLLILFIVTCSHVFSQQTAVVKKTGKEVLLMEDGTWIYAPEEQGNTSSEIAAIYSKPKDAKYVMESKRINYGIWLNKNKWICSDTEKDQTNPTEFKFRLMGEDAYAMTIAERIEVQIDTLVKIAFQNAVDAAPDVKLIKDEWRKVNGVDLRFLQMEGTISGIRFVYLGYYYSDKNGSLQFLTYTSSNLLARYRSEMESLLNGLVIMDK